MVPRKSGEIKTLPTLEECFIIDLSSPRYTMSVPVCFSVSLCLFSVQAGQPIFLCLCVCLRVCLCVCLFLCLCVCYAMSGSLCPFQCLLLECVLSLFSEECVLLFLTVSLSVSLVSA